MRDRAGRRDPAGSSAAPYVVYCVNSIAEGQRGSLITWCRRGLLAAFDDWLHDGVEERVFPNGLIGAPLNRLVADFRQDGCGSPSVFDDKREGGPWGELAVLHAGCVVEETRALQYVTQIVIGYDDEQVGAFRTDQSLGIEHGGVGRAPRFDDRSSHVSGLLVSSSPEGGGFTKESARFPSQKASEESEKQVGDIKLHKAPEPIPRALRRLALFVASGAVCLFGMALTERSFAGGWRRKLGAVLCFVGPLSLLMGWGIT